jgi:hypothetical protein
MLDKMIARQEEDFKQFGGIRERMHAARSAVRAQEWDKGIYSRLNRAKNLAELTRYAAEIKRKVDETMNSIKKRKGW